MSDGADMVRRLKNIWCNRTHHFELFFNSSLSHFQFHRIVQVLIVPSYCKSNWKCTSGGISTPKSLLSTLATQSKKDVIPLRGTNKLDHKYKHKLMPWKEQQNLDAQLNLLQLILYENNTKTWKGKPLIFWIPILLLDWKGLTTKTYNEHHYPLMNKLI